MDHNFEIVFIDDEKEVLEIYQDYLSQTDYHIKLFSNPFEAKDYIEDNQNKIIMIFTDYNMPDLNGIELREQILKKEIQIPYIVITGYPTKDMALRSLELSISNLLPKPVTDEDVLGLIEKFGSNRKNQLIEDREMILGFLEEAHPMIEEIEGLILSLEEDPEDIETINVYFRLLHTIKGTAACLGLTVTSEFAHKYEDFVSLIKNGQMKVTRNVIDVLLAGFDKVKFLINEIESQFSDSHIDIDDLTSVLKLSKESNSQKENDPSSKSKSENQTRAKKVESMNVSLETLDHFMELSGEITVLKNSLTKSFKGIEAELRGNKDVEIMDSTLEGMHKVINQLQNEITEMRKVSLKNIFRPFKRVIRDVAKANNKKVDFIIEGDSLLVDNQIARLLTNTLIHLIRNSVDHGLENIDDRLKANKPEEGSVILKASDLGESLRIEIIDDGKGIDSEIIKNKALEKELYTELELSKMSQKKVFEIIFESGFSTAKEVTDISGRGVGMDMVRSSIKEKGGQIEISSEVGKGSTFALTIPYPKSVLIINSLLVESCGQRFVISTTDVDDVVYLEGENLQKIENIKSSFVYRNSNELIPTLSIGKEFNLQSGKPFQGNCNLVIIRYFDQKYALIVDKVLDLEEVVKRPLTQVVQEQVHVFSGASILGSGEVALMLDIEKMAEKANLTLKEHQEELSKKANFQEEKAEYLSFTLDPRREYVLPLPQVFRLEKVALANISYTGSQALMKYRGQTLPLIDISQNLEQKTLCSENLPQDSLINVIVIKEKEQLVGFIVNEINDVYQTTEAIDSSVLGHHKLLGTIFLNNKTLSVVDTSSLINFRENKRKEIISVA